ncbi:MAG TPA: helix-turn-helix domain-containing protein, partial [Actinomycetes bacterium]|nr:helix-turn-helix domain-containing protein [Actinomycetes bacterium]
KLTALRATRKLRPATDREHAEDIRAGGDPTVARRLRPLTYREIAAEVGITPAHVGYLFTGERDNPTLKVLQALANLYEVPVGYLADTNTEHGPRIEQELARGRLRLDRSILTMADRLNGLVRAIPPGGDTDHIDERLAEIAGCTVEEIRGLRAGTTRTISFESVKRLAEDAFGVTLGYLVDGADADRIEERVELLREFADAGALKTALDMLHVKEADHQRALAQMIDAFIRVEAMEARSHPGPDQHGDEGQTTPSPS